MARIRTIKPEIWQDEDLAMLPPEAMLLAIGLLNHADDEGYFKAHPKLVESAVFPIRDLTESSVSIQGMLTQLANIGYLELYTGTDGKEYGFVVNFARHQKVNRPTPSKFKGLRPITEDSVSPHGALTAGKEQGTGNREQGRECESAPAPAPEHNQPATQLDDSSASDFFEKHTQLVDSIGGQPTNVVPIPSVRTMTMDWEPGAGVLEQLLNSGIPEEFVLEVLPRFRAHYAANAVTFVNWDAKLAGWVVKDWQEKSHSWKPAAARHQDAGGYATAAASQQRLTDTSW